MKDYKIILHIAVLRYRGLYGTQTLTMEKLLELTKLALEETFENHSFLFESWTHESQSEEFIRLISTKSQLSSWPVVTLDLLFHEKSEKAKVAGCSRNVLKKSKKRIIAVRIHVARDIAQTAWVRDEAVNFCVENNIVVIKNLFSFAQTDFDYNGCAELDILEIVKSLFVL